MYSTQKGFTIYYPESNTAYKYAGKKGQGQIDFMVNFLNAACNDFNIFKEHSNLILRQKKGDSVYYHYESKMHTKESPLAKFRVTKHIVDGMECFSSIIIRNEKNDTVSTSRFENYKRAGGIFYPTKSILNNYYLKKLTRSILIVDTLNTGNNWPAAYKKFKIPRGCKVENF
jgi:hypothetical protein